MNDEIYQKAEEEVVAVLADEPTESIQFLLEQIKKDLVKGDWYFDHTPAQGGAVCGCFYGTLWISKHQPEIESAKSTYAGEIYIPSPKRYEFINLIEETRSVDHAYGEEYFWLTHMEKLLIQERENGLEIIQRCAQSELARRA